MMPDEKMDVGSQSDRGVEERGRVAEWEGEGTGHRVRGVIVIDWVHCLIAILGFNQHQTPDAHKQPDICTDKS